jgi:2-polyprenyl-3-methyl-5-hydroxy-6-metoxy-1,4-benzoquinol methylase
MKSGVIKKAVKNLTKKFESQTEDRDNAAKRDFSLESGERQTAETLEGIRYDHKVRYNYAINYMKEQCSRIKPMFGLDTFCGTGYGTYMLSSSLICPVLGIDGSSDAIAFSNRHYANEQTFYSHKIFPFQLPRDVFDFITCYESLEHVDKASLFVELLSISLKKGGFLFLSTPNEACFQIEKNPNPFHYKHYTRQEVMSLVSEITELELIIWLGQNLYSIHDGRISANLSDNEMELLQLEEGQLIVYVFRKR